MLNPIDIKKEEQNAIDTILQSLNKEQKEAVITTSGPVLILSGAGTGKTRVLTSRVAYILSKGLCSAYNVLCLTFTNKAAKEMKDRIEGFIGSGASNSMWIGTFHSMFLRIIRKHHDIVGLSNNFSIFDADDQKKVAKKVLEELNLDTKIFPPALVVDLISRMKDKNISANGITAEFSHHLRGNMQMVYKLYQNKLRSMDSIDFGDFLMLTIQILESDESILQYYQQKFQYIMVDEYQDTNHIQYKLIKMLSDGHKNLCVVGDANQSIYSWRGAEIANILTFEKDFKDFDVKILKLETNYRSTKHILNAASHLVNNNKQSLDTNLQASSENLQKDALKVQVRACFNGEMESQYVAEEIENLQNQGVELSDIAILVRAGWQTRSFEESFIKTGISYKVVNGMKFYERKEIKDILAYIKLLFFKRDAIAFERAISYPKRGVGPKKVEDVIFYANQNNIDLIQASAELLENGKISAKAGQGLKEFLDNYYKWQSMLNGEILDKDSNEYHHGELVKYITQSSGYMDSLKKSKKIEDESRIDNIRELIGGISANFDNLQDFLDHISLIADIEQTEKLDDDFTPQVSIMTLHAAKGLEFEVVFLPGWEEGIFPNGKVLEEGGDEGEEEERRIAYVGITRGRKAVFITYASSRLMFGKWQNNLPSKFLNELPKKHIEHNTFTRNYM